ncbi:MAG: hypothetical protein O3A66_01235 [Proteobacteria bacterium]|nr:hypothetical protein [Pseudomonadota bacterium]
MNACTVLNGRSLSMTRPFSLNITPPSGSPQYKMGWSNGCESGLAAVNTTVNLMAKTHRYYINGQLWNYNPEYKTAWKDGYNHCTYHMFTFLLNSV